MSWMVRSGTTEAMRLPPDGIPEGWVAFEGQLPEYPIWDAGINNMRSMTAQEIAALPTPAQMTKNLATGAIDNGDTATADWYGRALVAVVLATRDEFNRMRQAIPHRVVSIVRSGTVATITTAAPHGLSVGDTFAIAGADQSAYNREATIATVPSSTTWTVNGVTGNPTTPATGSIIYTRGTVNALLDITDLQLRDAIKAKIVEMAE